jgi:hypothetical protein
MTSDLICIFGQVGEGKSTKADEICRLYGRRAVYYDSQREVPPGVKYYSYPPDDTYSVEELERFIKTEILDRRTNPRFNLLAIDEINRYSPSKPARIPRNLGELNDSRRHMNLSLLLISRRPCAINQDLTNLSNRMYIYHLDGHADIKYLNDLKEGLGDIVKTLPRYHYVEYDRRDIYLRKPVAPDIQWSRRAACHTRH